MSHGRTQSGERVWRINLPQPKKCSAMWLISRGYTIHCGFVPGILSSKYSASH